MLNSLFSLRRTVAVATLALAAASPPTTARAAAVPTLRYTLTMPEPQTHYFNVEMELGGFPADYTDVKMPVWAPGSYLIREFERHVESLEGHTLDGKLLAVDKINKNTWRVYHPRQGNFRVNYRVYAYELSVRTSFIDADHGYLNGSSVFMFPADNKALGSTLTVRPAAGWTQVSTALPPAGGGAKFTYKAANYDELADSPIEIGNHKVLNMTVNGTPHQVAMYGTYGVDETQLLTDMKKVCEAAHRVVGQNPLDRPYVFIVHNLERGGGGLEHLYSTTLEVSRSNWSTPTGYRNFLALVAHEYFHLWNVKRIRPIALGPFDYDQENYTRLLWVSEGMTEYVSNVLMHRAGYLTQQEYLDDMAGQMTAVENTPGNKLQPVSEASFDAWIRYYRPNENSDNTQISYYSKGQLVGLVLDLMIIEATKGQQHLDDVFRLLYDKYYLGLKRGFTDQEYQDAVAQVAGRRFDDFFRESVYGTRTLDYATALGYAGLELSITPQEPAYTLGATFANRGGKILVTKVSRGEAAWQQGLNVNDEVLQINGADPSEESVKFLLGGPAATPIALQVRRDGLTRDLTLTSMPNPDRKYSIRPMARPTKSQKQVLAKWLGSK